MDKNSSRCIGKGGGVLCLILALSTLSTPSHAKPITWPDGKQIMFMHDDQMTSAHAMYTLTPKLSLTARVDTMRDDDTTIAGVSATTLLKRWNFKDAQANIYVGGGLGAADIDGDTAPAVFSDVLADYETRRIFLSYEANGVATSKDFDQLWHRTRIGIAPYVGDYDDVHTWLMIQTDLRPNQDDDFTVTPMVRVFQTDWMVEGGVSTKGNIMTNIIWQF